MLRIYRPSKMCLTVESDDLREKKSECVLLLYSEHIVNQYSLMVASEKMNTLANVTKTKDVTEVRIFICILIIMGNIYLI